MQLPFVNVRKQKAVAVSSEQKGANRARPPAHTVGTVPGPLGGPHPLPRVSFVLVRSYVGVPKKLHTPI